MSSRIGEKTLKKFDLKDELKNWITSVEDLGKYVKLTDEEKKEIEKVIKIHPLAVTRYYASLIDKDDPNDPLRKIVVPSVDELSEFGTYDTSGEIDNTKSVGLQHKYKQTALLLLTHRCAVYCRFCFRKRLVGRSEAEIISNIEAARDYIIEHEEINNVLLSGGDPLILENHIVEHYLDTFLNIDHIDFVRIGTRIPIVLPQRISEDEELHSIFKKYNSANKRLHIVTHFNHPNEINEHSCKAIDALLRCGIPLHNQTVLLRGVNDNPHTMAKLQNDLVAVGVSPYYVFQCRPVRRATHFEVPLVEGIEILEEAKKHMSGLSKRFKYIMSHVRGKIEIIAKDDEYIYFKQHQAKAFEDLGKFFKLPIKADAKWLDDLL